MPRDERLKTARFQRILPWLLALASGLLLATAFSPWEAAEAAWIAWVPLWIALRGADLRRAFQLGLLSGAACWLTTMCWLTRVSVGGWIGLALYCAVYTAFFAVGVAAWLRRWGCGTWWRNLLFMAFAAAWWVALELARSTWFTGFPWNPLAITQHRNAALLQIAAWGGASAVSALLIWVNAGLGITALQYIDRKGRWGARPHPEVIAAFLVVACVFYGGIHRLRSLEPGEEPLRLALIQPCIPQDDKWDPSTVDLIYSRLQELTSAALRSGPADLVVWPETALPDDVAHSEPSYDLVYNLATQGVPMLVGSMDSRWHQVHKPDYYNSSFLFGVHGEPLEVYDKRHLVPFGEYIPLPDALPFLKALTPIQESFTPGTTSTVFQLPGREVPFAVLICFEDAVAGLARESVRNGARLLINQTNDAWFDPSAASRQHMLHSVLRAVENGVPVVRAANSGVSCVIDRRGAVLSLLEDESGGVRFPGFKRVEVRPAPAGMALTYYTRHGDAPAAMAGLAAFACLLALLAGERRGAPASAAGTFPDF